MARHRARERRSAATPTTGLPTPAPTELPVGIPDAPDGAASPVDLAALARLRGDRFFQVELDHVAVASYTDGAPAGRRGRRCSGATDLLGQIEELGWTLEHVAWWRDEHGYGVRGVYLFRSAGSALPTAAPAGPTGGHGPTHRRDIAI
jgi:hypothetical protein